MAGPLLVAAALATVAPTATPAAASDAASAMVLVLVCIMCLSLVPGRFGDGRGGLCCFLRCRAYLAAVAGAWRGGA